MCTYVEYRGEKERLEEKDREKFFKFFVSFEIRPVDIYVAC